MNINSLISSLTPLVQGLSGTSSAKPVSNPDNVIRDTFTRGDEKQNQAFFPVYTRAAASGSALQKADSPAGQDEQGNADANTDTPVASDNSGAQKKEAGQKDVNGPKKSNGEPLSTSEKELLSQLQKADQAVHTHEMAHLAAAGGYATSGASYTYKRGPDGKNYAVGGEVHIDTSDAGTPAATIAKLQTVRRAALAPADPSGQDQRVAAQASIRIAEAAQELMKIATQENKSAVNSGSQAPGPEVSGNDKPGQDGLTANQIYSRGAPSEKASSKTAAQPLPATNHLLQRYGRAAQKNSLVAPTGSLDLIA